jgi:inward rectifier potassium channel
MIFRRPKARVRRIGERQIIAEGLEAPGWTDFYYGAMMVSWPAFIAALAVIFLLLNAFFACVYLIGGAPIANARPGSFFDAFFFSVETTSTVGYGDMHPQTMFGHVVATVENFVGLMSLAVMTGLVFARFSRPHARILFARHPVIFVLDGQPTLAIRIANGRNSFISEATAKLWMLGPIVSAEGRSRVAFRPMKLQRYENPTFTLTWTLFHPIDEQSPLAGMSESDLAASPMNFVVTVVGLDETSAQVVRARKAYAAQDVRANHEFVDVFSIDDNGVRHVDYSRLHETRAIGAPVVSP